MSSKSAAAYLIDPLNAPEPSQDTGPGAHFTSTFAPAKNTNTTNTSPQNTLPSNNPFRDDAGRRTPPQKSGVIASERAVRGSSSPPSKFPDYREQAFAGTQAPPSYDAATSPKGSPSGSRPRRTSSLRERFPGDTSHKPLERIEQDSKKAYRSDHLKKKHQPGPDLIDRLDPALGGRAYHHEGPFDAALLARNTSYNSSPIAALQSSNAEALKATPAENVRDAVERHQPLDGVAALPPGVPDRFGRTLEYEEGADLMREEGSDGPGYKRWADKDYDKDDLKGQGDTFALDRALKAHHIDDRGAMEMTDHAKVSRDYHRAERNGLLDSRDPVTIAGGESKYVDMEIADTRARTSSDVKRTGSLRAAGENLKKRIGSLKHKNRHDE